MLSGHCPPLARPMPSPSELIVQGMLVELLFDESYLGEYFVYLRVEISPCLHGSVVDESGGVQFFGERWYHGCPWGLSLQAGDFDLRYLEMFYFVFGSDGDLPVYVPFFLLKYGCRWGSYGIRVYFDFVFVSNRQYDRDERLELAAFFFYCGLICTL